MNFFQLPEAAPFFSKKGPFSRWFSAHGRSEKVTASDREKGCALCYDRGDGRLHRAPDSGDGCGHADWPLSATLTGGPGPALIIAPGRRRRRAACSAHARPTLGRPHLQSISADRHVGRPIPLQCKCTFPLAEQRLNRRVSVPAALARLSWGAAVQKGEYIRKEHRPARSRAGADCQSCISL